jgi:hypothetical protein
MAKVDSRNAWHFGATHDAGSGVSVGMTDDHRIAKAREDASRLCVAVFLKGRTEGRFVMRRDELLGVSKLPQTPFDVAMAWAAERDWLHARLEFVELKAAGIHVAKASLDLA